MNPINERPHKKLMVWQKGIEMVARIYSITESFPKKEEFGLVTQLRRAAVSVPSNIAEGLTRKSKADKLRFLNISQSSLSEIDTHLEISKRLNYLRDGQFESIETELVEIQKLLGGLIRSIEQ